MDIVEVVIQKLDGDRSRRTRTASAVLDDDRHADHVVNVRITVRRVTGKPRMVLEFAAGLARSGLSREGYVREVGEPPRLRPLSNVVQGLLIMKETVPGGVDLTEDLRCFTNLGTVELESTFFSTKGLYTIPPLASAIVMTFRPIGVTSRSPCPMEMLAVSPCDQGRLCARLNQSISGTRP